ncbi:MAG: glycosyltransferase [Clostridia bacterium]|nr:glycosyltransferase [Clostridia bacterium]
MSTNILWVTNGIMPDMREAMGMPGSYGGSWLQEPARLLTEDGDYHLHIITPYDGKELVHKTVKGMDFYLLPSSYLDRMKRPSKKYRAACHKLIKEIDPAVIHLHGGEFAIGIPFAEYPGKPKLLSIQGIISKINSDYFYGGISVPSWVGCLMPWNIRTFLPMKLQHARNKWRAASEIRQMQQIDAITGCTRWDYTYSMLINPKLGYYDVDYAIRREFSQHRWDVNKCDRHTFLIGSMAVPLKGMHRALEALALLVKKYPDAKLRVVGGNTFASRFRVGYAHWLYKKAKKLGVLDHIELLGPQDTRGMVNTMLRTHSFALSSCIENGPNMMMEAMYLGMPCVCSYVGGAMQFAKEGDEALFYRFEEPEILAYELDRIWQDDDFATSLSEKAARRAAAFEDFNDVSLHYKDIYADMIKKYTKE